MSDSEPDIFSVITEVSKTVTFDLLMMRDPSSLTKADRLQLIRLQRQQRASWQAKADERKAKKEEADND